MTNPEPLSSAPAPSLPATHPIIGVAQCQCAVCFDPIQLQPITAANFMAGEPLIGHCSRCKVYVDLPILKADCAIVEPRAV